MFSKALNGKRQNTFQESSYNYIFLKNCLPSLPFLFEVLVCVLLIVSSAYAQNDKSDQEDTGMFGLSLEEAMDIEVISVTRTKGQNVFTSPAAIYVITQDEIRRSGLYPLPELFRMVPGMHVGRIDSSSWAISTRGFNLEFNNRMLVLIDGRSVYTPRFGGVYWDMQNLPLEIIERIEVVRGPGGTLWGANAVNGVINIITKKAKDTQGGLLSVGGGSENQSHTVGVYGDRFGDNGYYRVYGMFDLYDDFKAKDGSDTADEWHAGQGGYRFDWQEGIDRYTLQGDFHHNHRDTNIFGSGLSKKEAYGTNVLGRWTRSLSEDSEISLQLYYDLVRRHSVIDDEARHIGDLDLQHSFRTNTGHSIVWGFGYRVDSDEMGETAITQVGTPRKTRQTISAYIQDSFYIVPELLKFSVGSKFEQNQFTGFEFQPSLQMVYTPNERNVFWGAVSRAVRIPTRAEDDFTITGNIGNDGLDSEVLRAYELGYRYKPNNRFSLDLALFANHYDDLIRRDLSQVDGPMVNANRAEAHGVEIAANLQATDRWKLICDYTFFDIEIHGIAEENEHAFPANIASLRSYMDIRQDLEFNCMLYYADNATTLASPSNMRLDLGLTWRPAENMEISVWGQNVLEPQQGPELTSRALAQPVENQRAVIAKVTWRF